MIGEKLHETLPNSARGFENASAEFFIKFGRLYAGDLQRDSRFTSGYRIMAGTCSV